MEGPAEGICARHAASTHHRVRTFQRGLAMLTVGVCIASPLRAQTIDDELMLPKHELLTGLSYSYETWEDYWEGALKRRNGNIGEITTKTAQWMANFGVTDRLNVIASVPYVWTRASQGVLQGLEDFQDLTIAGKYQFLETALADQGTLRAMGVIAGSVPLSDYTPDFMPLSVGTASKRLSGRLTLSFKAPQGWFVNSSAAYTWRENVTLDRPFYFTDGQLFLTNEVEMPNVFDYMVGAGYAQAGLTGSLSLSEQRTRGGGDIRRQDMPFVSNRMNFSRLGAMAMYSPRAWPALELRLAYTYTLEGRNVGQSTIWTSGITYRLGLDRRSPR